MLSFISSPRRAIRTAFVLTALLAATTLLAGCPDCFNGTAGPGACIQGENGDPCNGGWDCNPDSICWNAICIADGALRVSLSWTVTADFDLHVMTPDGTEIFFGNASGAGGYLDVDDCVGDSCRSEGTHVENIVFEDEASSGDYQIWVINYNGSSAGDFEVEVVGDSGNQTFSGTLDATSGLSSEVFVYSL